MEEKILKLLENKGIPLSAGAIAKYLDISLVTTKKYLQRLEEMELLKTLEAEITIKNDGVFRNDLKIWKIKLYTVKKNGIS